MTQQKIQHQSTGTPVKVKVCGITTREDAEKLDALGIDYLGFNFYSKSKRYVHPEAAAQLIKPLSHAVPVGIFVDEPLDQLRKITEITGIQVAQLHGSETPAYIQDVSLPVIKALGDTEIHTGVNFESKGIAFLLFDTKAKGQFGGTGTPFDWNLLSQYKGPLPYFLAGGLGPENLREALACCRPYAVDINSRVEKAPGVKDIDQIVKCLEILRSL